MLNHRLAGNRNEMHFIGEAHPEDGTLPMEVTVMYGGGRCALDLREVHRQLKEKFTA